MASQTLARLATDLREGRRSSESLVQDCLDRAQDPSGEGSRAFLEVHASSALATAKAIDAMRAWRTHPSPHAGLAVSIKDLFDVAGQVTAAGSRVLAGSPAASADAAPVAALRRAGFVFVGRTNMSEFAYSGLGLNPHFGTPLNPYDRATGRIPGGSTSGGAISVIDGMAHAALGSDTGGSCRIPAAFTGLVGFKPTASRMPSRGTLPLSTSLDTVGTIAPSVQCCATLDAILAGIDDEPLPMLPLAGLRFLVPTNVVMDGIDREMAASFERTLNALSRAGATLTPAHVDAFDGVATLNAKGGFPAAESYQWHRHLLSQHAEAYDPRVAARIARGAQMDAADYLWMLAERGALTSKFDAQVRAFDAVVMPTVPIVAPTLAEVEQDDAFTRINLLVLRNSTLFNIMDGCAISVPMHPPGQAPAGVMLGHVQGSDRRLLAVAAAVESLLSGERLA